MASVVMNKDYYKILGVTEQAGADDIKKAYRQLAKKHHPDAHPNDKKAEERFKEISEAYSVLSDDKKRAQYDQMRKLGASGFSGFDFRQRGRGGARTTYSFDDVNLNDIFSQFFSANSGMSGFSDAAEDLDLYAEITIPFETALQGGKQIVALQGERQKKISVTIPAGIEDGKKIRLSGQGRSSAYSRKNGDLFITVHVQPHPFFRRQGLDVYRTVPINLAQALLGSVVQAITPYGHKVEIKIPAGTQNEKLFKLKGLGVKTEQSVGDFYLIVHVDIPTDLSETAKETIKKFAAQTGMDF